MRASLHLIADRRTAGAQIRSAVTGGVDVVQLRDKGASAIDLWQQAQAIWPMIRDSGRTLLINDRLDVALAVGAGGVHLGGRSLSAAVARPLAPGLVLGASVHSLSEAEALEAAVDYLTFGQVFPSASHPGQPAKGLAALAAVVEGVSRPVLAIGGIQPENVASVLAAGASGVVVISAVLGSSDVAAASRRLRQALDACPDPLRSDPCLSRQGGVSR